MIFKNDETKLKMRSKIEETDGFWDMGELTPKRKEVFVDRSDLASEKADSSEGFAVISFGESVADTSEKINVVQYQDELLDEYVPETPLIEAVKIYRWQTKYTFYERFRLDAERFFEYTGKKTEPVRYFSYVPGYLQMSSKQREWYFYWRDCVRNKQYIPTDSSYILLYVYEIINLPNKIDAKLGLDILCDIWENYRDAYTKLDKYMSEWVCDYCIINKLPVPFNRMSSFLNRVLSVASFKNFYIECEKDSVYESLLMERLSAYSWRNSKYLNTENKEIFEKHIKNAFIYASKKLARADGRFDGGNGRLTKKSIVRDSFSGALCAYKIKRRVEIDYWDIYSVNDLGFIVTDMVRYCENRVRAHLGIRARLTVQNLTEQHKAAIDEYFNIELPVPIDDAEAFSGRRTDKKREFSVSFDKAREIENRSWETTERLVRDDDADEFMGDLTEKEAITEEKKMQNTPESETLDIALTALRYISDGDISSFMKLAEEGYMMPETLVECVNELCYETFGDIGVEEKDGGYRIIPDYEQEIFEWLKR